MRFLQELSRCFMVLGLASREEIAPGALYRLMSSDFEARRSCSHSCAMPMIFTRDRIGHGESNWNIEEMWPQCQDCRELSSRIARHYASRYNVKTFGASPCEPDCLGHVSEEEVRVIS